MKNHRDKVIYTCITSAYDYLLDHKYINSDWDYICFTDTDFDKTELKSWQVKPLSYKDEDVRKTQRWHKINPHKLLNKYRYSIYLDANIEATKKDFFEVVEELIEDDTKVAFAKHPQRDCVYDEIEACIALKKDDPKIMRSQIDEIKSKGFPRHFGMYAGGIIFRQHNDDKVTKLMQNWWEMVEKYSYRDQLSLPYVLWQNKMSVTELPFTIFDNQNEPLYYWPHNKNYRKTIRSLNKKLQKSEQENVNLLNIIDELNRQVKSKNNIVRNVALKITKIGKKNV